MKIQQHLGCIVSISMILLSMICLSEARELQLKSYKISNFTRVRRQSRNCDGFRCISTEECIDGDKRCDGTVHCKDGSDEFNDCWDIIKCPDYLFRCDYGACVDGDKKCNGKKDCRDNSDEANCILLNSSNMLSNCKSDQFECKSGQCISLDEKCNGATDCIDKTDETKETCLNMFCPGWTFKCSYGACVDGFARCNGIGECLDNSDEEFCPPTNSNETEELTTKRPATPRSKTGPCVLPDHPENGQWKIPGTEDVYPGDRVPTDSFLSFGCNEGFTLSSQSPYVACLKNDWSVLEMPKCLKLCPPLYSTEMITIKCHDHRKVEIMCSEATDGASGSFTCAPYYEPIDRTKTNRYCWGGSWNLPPPSCQPVCGEKKVSAVPLIVNGVHVEKGDFPWVTAVFRKFGETNFTNVCGGSMLTQRTILTAAHCVTQPNGAKISTEQVEVGVGKYYRSYKDARDTQAQYSKVEKIIVPDKYKGDSQRLSSDIAVLVTKDTLLLSKVVQPVCYQDVRNQYLEEEEVGVVTGWGHTLAGGSPSEDLLNVDIPYKPDSVCSKELPIDWIDKYLTYDKMCAGHYNKSIAVCRGDSGSGLVFKKDNRFYVHGIVSVSHNVPNIGCNIQVSALYTKVASHYEWLDPIISKYTVRT